MSRLHVKPQELLKLYQEAEKQGCEVRMKNGHVRVVCPAGVYFGAGTSGSGARTVENTRAGLRRMGVEL